MFRVLWYIYVRLMVERVKLTLEFQTDGVAGIIGVGGNIPNDQ